MDRRDLLIATKSYVYVSKVTDVYDGDSLTLSPMDLGMRTDLRDVKVRWYGIDAAELHKGTNDSRAEGERIRDMVEGLILGKWITIVTRLDRHGNDEEGKYGRLLGEVLAPIVEGGPIVNLNRLLVLSEAVPENTYGDGPAEWTEPSDVIQLPL